jgi:coenzyme F420-reducing hydrogenase beta subunit
MNMKTTHKCFYGYINDETLLRKSSSGGVASSLAKYIISQKGVVYGVRYAPDYHSALYIRIENEAELGLIAGSKYITTKKKLADGRQVFASVLEDLKYGNKVLFFGLPCDVAGLKNYLTKLGECCENLLTVDLICHGPLDSKIHSDYISYLERVNKSKILDFSVRYKKPFWTPVYLMAKFENGTAVVKPLYATDLGIAFAILGKESCYKCQFKGDRHQSDITIGDFWGASKDYQNYNKYGTSVVASHSPMGTEIIMQLKDFVCSEIDEDCALKGNPMYYVPRKKDSRYSRFNDELKSVGLHKAAFHARSFRSKCKYLFNMLISKVKY